MAANSFLSSIYSLVLDNIEVSKGWDGTEYVKLKDVEKEASRFVFVPKELFEQGKYVERVRVLLSDYDIIERKKLSRIMENRPLFVASKGDSGEVKFLLNKLNTYINDLEELLQPSGEETK